jgi:hypothetical protein
MLGAPLLEPVYLKIPPGSFKSLKKFSDELQHEGIPFASMVTRVSFSQDETFEFNFKVIQALTDKEAPRVLPLMDDPQTGAIIHGNGVSGMRELPAPAARKPPERIETGLMEAFGEPAGNGADVTEKPPQPVARGRGRPAGAPNKPKAAPIIEHEAAPPPSSRAPEPGAGGTVAEEEGSWDESDTDLDDTVAKLMGDKASKMMK